MSENLRENMSWAQAYLLLWEAEDGKVVVSSDGWQQQGKYVFMGRAHVALPDGGMSPGPRRLWFVDFNGVLNAWAPSDAGSNRSDWRVGASRGKPTP